MADEEQQATPNTVEPRRNAPQTVGELFRREEETTNRLTSVATKYLSAKRAANLALSAIHRTPLLLQCTPKSFMGALMAATGLGLEPNTPREHAYLIPYKKSTVARDQNGRVIKNERGELIFDETYECQLQLGYRGFVALMSRNKETIVSIDAETVYDVDEFRAIKGSAQILEFEKSLIHERFRNRDPKMADSWLAKDNPSRFDFSPGLRASYCATHLRGGGLSFTLATLPDLIRARAQSQTWTSLRTALEKTEREATNYGQYAANRIKRARDTYATTPWVLWEEAMCTKTAIRRHVKIVDWGTAQEGMHTSIASDLDALSDAGMLDMEDLADADKARALFVEGHGEIPKTIEGESEPSSESMEDGERGQQDTEPRQPEPDAKPRRQRRSGEPKQPDAAMGGQPEPQIADGPPPQDSKQTATPSPDNQTTGTAAAPPPQQKRPAPAQLL